MCLLTPLEIQPSLLTRLLRAGCDINACDKCGFSAIDYAAAGNLIEYARLLVRHGAHFPMKYAWQVRKEGLPKEVLSRFPFDALGHSINPNVLHLVETRFYVRLIGDELPGGSWRTRTQKRPATCRSRRWRFISARGGPASPAAVPSIQRCFKAVMLCNEWRANRNELSLHADVWSLIFGFIDLADPVWPRLDLAPPVPSSPLSPPARRICSTVLGSDATACPATVLKQLDAAIDARDVPPAEVHEIRAALRGIEPIDDDGDLAAILCRNRGDPVIRAILEDSAAHGPDLIQRRVRYQRRELVAMHWWRGTVDTIVSSTTLRHACSDWVLSRLPRGQQGYEIALWSVARKFGRRYCTGKQVC